MAEAQRSLGPYAAVALGAVLVVVAAFGGRVTGIAQAEPIEGYRVVYRITDRAGERPSVRTEVVEVSRPYGGRVEERSGPPPGRTITSGKVSNREFGWQLDDGGKLQFGLRRPPGGPTRDVSYASMLDAARAGIVEAAGGGEHLGRRCTWFVFEDPFPEPLTPVREPSQIEACIDPAGIMLREIWTIKDRLARDVEAVELSTNPPPDDRFLEGLDPRNADVTQPEAADVLRSNVVVGDDVGGKPPKLELLAPDDWDKDRDAVVVQAAQSGRVTQFSALTFLRGVEMVVVEIALLPDYEPAWTMTEGTHVQVGEATQARLLFFGDHVELRMDTELGFARIAAPTCRIAISFGERLRPAS